MNRQIDTIVKIAIIVVKGIINTAIKTQG